MEDSSETEIKNVCIEKGIEPKNPLNKGQLLDHLMSNLVLPKLIEPTFIIDYPKVISPLAKARIVGIEEIWLKDLNYLLEDLNLLIHFLNSMIQLIKENVLKNKPGSKLGR